MRYRMTTAVAALLLASATVATAQGQAQTSTPPPDAVVPSLGTIDVGYRGTSATGDVARYERYRDLRDGAYSMITFGKKTDTLFYSGSASNIGYRDQSYRADYNNGRMKGFGLWNQTPLNYSYLTSTPWVETSSGSTASFTLDPAARLLVQNKTAGVIGIPTTAAQLATPSIYRGLAKPFDMQQRRDVAGFGLAYDVKPDLNINMSFSTTKKSGTMPWDASFAFNNANELPLPLDNRSNDMSLGAEWANKNGMVRVGWDGSWFTNQYHDLVWDNPLRATDFNNGLVPPLGPYDPSGYSNGNGPAQGRVALAPDTSMNVVSAMGMYKMPSHSTLSATLTLTSMKQNDTLIPWTINSVINQPLVFASFHELASLPRSTAGAEMKGVNALFNFNTRPNKYFGFTMKYRYNSHDNQTPHFDAIEYVRFDAVPEETGGETEQFDIKRRTLDVNATFNVMPFTALRVGYGYDAYNRTGRSFSDMADDTFRVSLDTTRNQYVTFRALYEHVARIGSGFSESAIEDGGAQPDLRFYDEADRTRNRGTLLVILTPFSTMDATVSYARGKDVYQGEGHEFGLLDNENSAVNFGMNFTPKEHIAFGFNYGLDKYSSFQSSRNANPPCALNVPPCAPGTYDSWSDPNRTWNLDNDEKVNNFNLYVDLIKAIKDTDVRIAYDFSDSDNAFVHGGPRVQELSTNTALTPGAPKPCATGLTSCFEALPTVTNKWRRFTLDLKHYFSPKVGVGFAWYYEKFDVRDYAAIDTDGSVGFTAATGTPRIDYLGEISTGYGVRPYQGNTAAVRLLYKF